VFFVLGCVVDKRLEGSTTSRKARLGNPSGG
jgi:hypothetical protein